MDGTALLATGKIFCLNGHISVLLNENLFCCCLLRCDVGDTGYDVAKGLLPGGVADTGLVHHMCPFAIGDDLVVFHLQQ